MSRCGFPSLWLFSAGALLLFGCGAGEKNEAQAGDVTAHPDYQKGLDLATKHKCFVCHKIDEPFTGPSYRDIANKYAGASAAEISELAGKIIHGSTGVWGNVPMIAHPAIPEEDAETPVRYILLLKK
ncbi:MAG TPA: cytochrome c class I [Chitinophagaceae bacterium]|nr:cytochrome c class I [Chitinophagaceae bacterium]